MSTIQVNCPQCGHNFPVDEALSQSLEEKIKKDFQQKLQKEAKDLAQQANEKLNIELNLLKDQLDQNQKKLEQAQNIELELRKQKQTLEEEKREFELQKQRQIDFERDQIRRKTEESLLSQFQLKEKDKDKIIEDLRKSLSEAQRKANQSSQQLQGESAELNLEELLRTKFIYDQIEPVAKGVRGADLSQIVKTPLGNICGVILWESKRTKAWSNDWTTKLKDDLRSTKANIPVIVSTVLPSEIKSGLGLYDGVWLCEPQLAIPLAEILRTSLVDIAREKFVSKNQANKAEILYQYIVSNDFRQQVEALAEVFLQMRSQITREKAALEKIWKSREIEIERLFKSTASIVGSLQGVVGQSLPPVKGLDLLEP